MSKEYNEKSHKRLGWKWKWLGLSENQWDLVTEKVKEFQEKNELLKDGKLGPHTFSVLKSIFEQDKKHILCNGVEVPIAWKQVIRFDENSGLKLKKEVYREINRSPMRKISQIITHWDVALSAKDCVRILNRRKASTHFVIDNDGTIYQLLDTKDRAWHSGFHDTNKLSVGIDISNAYYLKYQKTYEDRGFGSRPIIENATVRGKKLKPFLGFYDVQIKAYKALVSSLTNHYPIELKTILDKEGLTADYLDDEASRGKRSGVFSHYHVDKRNRKIDCAGLDIANILEEIKNG